MHLSEDRLNISQKHARRALVYADFCHQFGIKRGARRILGDGLLKAWIATGNDEYGGDAERTLKQTVLDAQKDGDFSALADGELETRAAGNHSKARGSRCPFHSRTSH